MKVRKHVSYEHGQGIHCRSIYRSICILEQLKLSIRRSQFCKSKNYTFQEKLKSSGLSEESFKDNDSKTLYFTGFPKAQMMFFSF